MGLTLLVIVFIAGAEWYKHRRVPQPVQQYFGGSPDNSNDVITTCDLPNLVNDTVQTEAAYHQYPVDYAPAFGVMCNDGEELLI